MRAAVHSRKATSATSRGSTKTACLGGWRPSKGLCCVCRGSSSPARRSQLGLREAAADPAGVAQPPPSVVVLVVADQDGADRLRPAPLPGQPAADHELLAADVLDLQPGAAAPSGQVAAVEPLGDQPLEAALPVSSSSAFALAAVVAGRLPARAVERERVEPLAALGVGEVDERAPVEVQEVEDQVGDRDVGHPPPNCDSEARFMRLWSRSKLGRPSLVEGDHLAVEDRLAWSPARRPSARSSG